MKREKSSKQKRRVGRPSTGSDPVLTLRLPAETIQAIDASLHDGESRSDLIRAAIAAEIERRACG